MNEKLKVKILEDGVTAKEQNPLGEYIDYITVSENSSTVTVNTHRAEKWSEAESSLRTFDVPADCNGENPCYPIGSIHPAEILPNGKIKILQP